MNQRNSSKKSAKAELACFDQLAVETLSGVGSKVAEKLQRIGIRTVQDILFHLPLRYQDRTRIVPIASLRPGEQAQIEGSVESAEQVFAKRRMLLCRISDGTGSIVLRFFHFNAMQQAALKPGTLLRCFGEVRNGTRQLEMIHPEYKRMVDAISETVAESLTPIYPTTEGVHQLKLRDLSQQALQLLRQQPGGLYEWIPAELLDELQLPELAQALHYVHRPPPEVSLSALESGQHPVQQRLAFEELLAHNLSLRLLRNVLQQRQAYKLATSGDLPKRFISSLPFRLTEAQKKVINEIKRDLRKQHPMLRLVQGDVGCGKTVVAAAAALCAIESGNQCALMAPTELLAEQHFANFCHWMESLGVRVEWLSGRSKGKTREQTLKAIASGKVSMIVGTHALFQEQVKFSKLALVIIDEQHRFGVHQRLALHDKGRRNQKRPHQLIMTATPIPRTLAMTAYADLDISVIDQLPPGRTPVTTVVIPDNRRENIIDRVRHACGNGRQAYWVCTLIDESEVLQCQAAADTAATLQACLPELSVGLLHGRLKPAEKEKVMSSFKAGQIQLLVATTVIEVGVDVANASLMIIENAERLGLAQLHQLRGRVGRGAIESSCVLVYQSPLSKAARARLAVMRESNDGFRIAQKDLEIRGPGEVLGTKQTGIAQMKIADLVRDQPLIPIVQASADRILRNYPSHAQPIIQRWVGEDQQYAHV